MAYLATKVRPLSYFVNHTFWDQTNKITKNIEDLKKSLTNEIQSLKHELDEMKNQINATINEFENVKTDMDTLIAAIQAEVIARLRIANHIYIGNGKDIESTTHAIQLACDGKVRPKQSGPS